MISLVASGADSNAAGASAFCGIPLPVGVQNGDLMLVAIAVPSAGVTVTPPSSDWQQIISTDPAQSLILSVWWTVALMPPVSLVFALSSSVQVVGTILVYRGADFFTPVDASAAVLTASSATHNVAGVSPSQAPEELVVFLAGAASGTYTTGSNFQEAVAKQQANASLSAQHKQATTFAPLAGFTETFSTPALGAAVTIALAPSGGLMSFDDAYRRVFEALPPGIDNVLDFTYGSGDFYKLTWNVGAALKLFFFDLIDILRAETVAYLSRYKLPDWENVFGLRGTRVAQSGTIPQRQAQVLGAWRSAAGQGSSIPVVQAVLGPLLGYNPSTTVQVVEPDVSALIVQHQYSFAADLVVGASSSGSTTIQVTDGGKASAMGAQLELLVDPPSALASCTFQLTAPDGTTFTWSGTATSWPNSPVKLYGPSFKGCQIQGNWTLTVTNGSGGSVTVVAGSPLFVEGIARGQQTGGAIFTWGVYADPAHLGENGTAVDLNAARLAIARLNFAYTYGNLLQSLVPYPDTDSGVNAAIPDECTPTL